MPSLHGRRPSVSPSPAPRGLKGASAHVVWLPPAHYSQVAPLWNDQYVWSPGLHVDVWLQPKQTSFMRRISDASIVGANETASSDKTPEPEDEQNRSDQGNSPTTGGLGLDEKADKLPTPRPVAGMSDIGSAEDNGRTGNDEGFIVPTGLDYGAECFISPWPRRAGQDGVALTPRQLRGQVRPMIEAPANIQRSHRFGIRVSINVEVEMELQARIRGDVLLELF